MKASRQTGLPFNVTLTPEADTAARLVFLSADFIRYRSRKTSAAKLPAVKCVVWDLDNTMWDGVLVEGMTKSAQKKNIKRILKALDERGILSSIASKNSHAVGLAPPGRVPESPEYFLVPQITWGPKSESIKTIAQRLNIGIETLAFVDDNLSSN